MPDRCSLWERNWAATMPPAVIAGAVRKGAVRLDCLPEMIKKEVEPLV